MKKLLGIIVLGLLLSGNAYAECLKGDCENGYGVYEYDKGKYEGNWKKGKKNGYGKYTWYKKGTYEGNWKKDKFHGNGIQIKSNGYKEEGEYRNGKRKLVTVIWSNGDVCVEYVGNSCRGDIIKNGGKSNNNNTNGNIEFTTSIGKHKNTCKELGFTPGTEKFGDCALKLIELEVAQQGNNKAAQQIQIVQQEAPYDGWMGELGLSILRGDFSRKTQQPAYRFPVQQKSVCRFQNNGFAQPTLNCTTR